MIQPNGARGAALQFYSAVASLVSALAAVLLTWPLVLDYLHTGLVPRQPTLIVAVGLAVVALLSLVCGLILDTVARARLEQRRLAYLGLPGPQASLQASLGE